MLRDHFGHRRDATTPLPSPPVPGPIAVIVPREARAVLPAMGPSALPPALDLVQQRVHRQLVEAVDQQQLASMSGDEARKWLREEAAALLAPQQQGLGDHRNAILDAIVDDVLGLGPLEPLLRDDSVSEIMVNGPESIWVERSGQLSVTRFRFRDNEHLARVIERIVSPLGRHVDEASPMVDARLPDGSRVKVVVPPAAPRGATITLRKFARQRLTDVDLVRFGTMSEAAGGFLRACVAAELNVIVSGGTGTGKTTLLNVLSSFIPASERIVTIEDPLELQLQQPHVVSLEARPAGIEGTHQITQRDLVRNALRMRPDRVIVGEVRGGEAFDMLQAMNTGHDGSISTVHANSPRDAVSRIENMVLMAGFDLPDHAVREQIASAVQLIVQITRLPDGSRRITHITEVSGMEGAVITLQDLFVFDATVESPDGRPGAMVATGLRPQFTDRFERNGVEFPAHLLRTDRWEHPA